MPRTDTLTRTLVAALAILALAAPAALARPSGPASPQAVEAAAQAERAQDLRRLKAGNSVPLAPERTTSKTTTDGSPAAGKGPVYWSYDYEAPVPQAADSPSPDGGTPWTAIAAGLAGAGLLAGGAVAMTRRRTVRPRVA